MSLRDRPAVWTKSTTRQINYPSSHILHDNSGTTPPGTTPPGPLAAPHGQGVVTTSGPLIRSSLSRSATKQGASIVDVNDSGLSVNLIGRKFSHSHISQRAGANQSADGASIYSKWDERGGREHNLRGPVMLQMCVHYMFFLPVLGVASVNWARQIRLFMCVFYFCACFFVLQISRLSYKRNPNSVTPLYLSLPPLVLLLFISREAHMITMVLWYVSFLIIYLQSGHNELQKHLIYYSVFFVVAYCLSVVGMNFFYVNGCSSAFCGVGLNPTISVPQEGVLAAATVMVVGCFVMLERFVKMNAQMLLERENHLQQLYQSNINLKRQLRRQKTDKQIDLESPLARAVQILKEVKENGVEQWVGDEIDAVITVLSSDQLYNPNLYQNAGDSDVHDWLKDMLLADKAQDTAHRTVSKQSSAGSMGVSIPQIVTTATLSADMPFFEMYEQNVNNINFDVEQLETASGQSLYYIAWSIFRQHGFFEQFNIPEPIFLRWLKKVQHGYRGTNPYHNAVHASDVTHSMHFFVTRARIWSVLTPEEKLASIIAPIIHDYMHPGVNNAFLITTRDALTMRYNDLSVLENFHCASVLEFTQEEQYNLFVNMTVDQRKLVREMVISMVLATDMAAHFEWIGKFKNKMSGSGFNFENKADRKIMLNMAIKCADVNNPTKPLEQSKRWTELIMEEFFRQGDIERSRGIPISMFMNRETTDIPKCQIGFIDFIAQPLFDAWYSFMQEDIQILMDNIKGNKNYWKNKSEKVSFGPIKPTPSSTESLSNTAKASALAIPPGSNIQTSVSTQQITNTKSSDSLAR